MKKTLKDMRMIATNPLAQKSTPVHPKLAGEVTEAVLVLWWMR